MRTARFRPAEASEDAHSSARKLGTNIRKAVLSILPPQVQLGRDLAGQVAQEYDWPKDRLNDGAFDSSLDFLI